MSGSNAPGRNRRSRRYAVAFALAVLLSLVMAGTAPASHPQPVPDINFVDYTPIGAYAPGMFIPSPSDAEALAAAGPNLSGEWVAYDTNVFESLVLPARHPGDTSVNDPPGTGDPRHGWCPPSTEHPEFISGFCANHQLEYLDYFERSMREILGEFGVTLHRYPFHSPGTGSRGGLFDAADGQAYNIAAVVPGADHPDETVLVSGHYDFTDSGPAAAWDSSEGHATVIRIAKIMADYWRTTGTRPSATVKFIPWDSEESGTFGSIDYVENNIPPGEERKVRGYFNLDPCAGAYPAFRSGVVGSRVPEVLQLADPNTWDDPSAERARIIAFNRRAETIVDEVFDYLDDRLTTVPGQPEIFVSDAEASTLSPSQRGEIVTAVGGLALFSSDYANFEAVGIPIFNLFPDYFGPHADGTLASVEGIGILHTPRDNLTTINALTSADQTGLTASEGWAKGLEMCAQLNGWYMLQPEMGGAQTASAAVVAYFEALPNEAQPNEAVTFDASGTYRYASFINRQLVPDEQLTYSWKLGDGTNATGRTVTHAYAKPGRYLAQLTVRDSGTGLSDSTTIPVEVVPPVGPVLKPPPARDADGTFTLEWTFAGTRDNFDHYAVEESNRFTTFVDDNASGDLGAVWTTDRHFSNDNPENANFRAWRKSEGSDAVTGNQFRSPTTSYWSGVVPTAPSPINAWSSLVLKSPFDVPKQGDTRLAYWSSLNSESDDEGRVDVAIDDGDPGTHPHWQTLDVDAEETPWVPGDDPEPFTYRTVSLDRFKGKQILIRFRYFLGPFDRALSQPAGWYVDDIRLYSAKWKEIGTTTATTFEVVGRRPGTYGYRVKAVYADGVATRPSNEETVEVTG